MHYALAVLLAAPMVAACERSGDRAVTASANGAGDRPRDNANAAEDPASTATAAPPGLAALAAIADVREAGRHLMAAPLGLHRLDAHDPEPTTMVVGVHGHESRGYEWRHAMVRMGEAGHQVWWYRWDYDQCPEPMAAELHRALTATLAEHPKVERVQVMAHSYGGVIAMLLAARYDGTPPLTVDVIASPLAGAKILGDRCDYAGPQAPAENATLRQWRTKKELDGAFEKFPFDPQVVDLPGEVTRLPETYEGHRLGHNWSISWVTDTLLGGAKP